MSLLAHALRRRRSLQLRDALIAGIPLAARVALVLALALALAVAQTLAPPGTARADGDPASDVLLTENVFYSYSTPVSSPLRADLTETVARAHASGFPIKVALIENSLDLGAIPQLFGKPEQYAKFLDYEITYSTVPRLLVVMPQGFGTVAAGPVSALTTDHIDRRQGANGLARAAIVAVQRLAGVAGYKIAIPRLPADEQAGTSDPLVWLLLAAAAVVLAMSLLGWRQLRPSRSTGKSGA